MHDRVTSLRRGFGGPPRASPLRDPFRHVAGALTRAELDDSEVREIPLVERILLDDGLDLPPVLANRQDDSAIAWNLATRDEEMAGGVVLLQEHDVRGHVRVNFCEVGLVAQFDEKHRVNQPL